MQKLCALLLLTLTAWLLVAPLGNAQSKQNLLPACCRRLGAHHCAQASSSAQLADRTHSSFRSAGCLLMPHRALALTQKLAGILAFAALAFLACWSPFSSTSALEGYAHSLARKTPRGPPNTRLRLKTRPPAEDPSVSNAPTSYPGIPRRERPQLRDRGRTVLASPRRT